MPINKVGNVDNVKTAKEVKEDLKEQMAIKNALYGAGKDGWTGEWFNKILDAYRNDRLSITGMSAEINLILSKKGIREDLLTDDDRIILMLYAHPIRYMGRAY